jgi:hypothetical protein
VLADPYSGRRLKEANMNRALAYFSISATLFFLAAVFMLLFLAPEVDPMHSGISFYALTKYAPVIDLALALIGLAGISLGIALWSLTPTIGGRIGIVLLVAWGCASILAGAYPVDAPDAAPTRSGSIHNMAGLNFLLIFPAALLIEATRSSIARSGWITSSYWLAWLLLITAILLFIFNGPLSSLGIGGLVQRLYWLVLASWILLKAQQVHHAGVISTTM